MFLFTGFSPNEIYNGELLSKAEVLHKKPCYKSGACTGFTIGKLEGPNANARYLPDFRDPGRDQMFFNQYVVSHTDTLGFASQGFANSGDSGAFAFQCVDRDHGKKSFACFGMVVGGTRDNYVLVTPIRDVLDALHLENVKKLCTFED